MKLKALELFGFKSFVDRTLLHFGDGITAIVGPNGVGKSNCVDALRWAMGEQSAKHLRGSEMQDVIFNGTDQRPPTGMAQVTLRFDLTDGRAPAGYQDYTEIEVERKLYRSGESEYLINKVPCRLRDVIDLFLGTGVGTKAYSIIEQGKIDQILSARPEERRFVIEEAAGISKFKSRKEAALRRLESTQANLARLKDVVAELRRQLNSLNRQAKKAERYKKLYDELKSKELSLQTIRYQKFQNDLERLEAERAERLQQETSGAARIAEEEAHREKERLTLAESERAVNDAQEKYYQVQNAVKLHEAALEYQSARLKDLARKVNDCAVEIQTAQAKREEGGREIEELNQAKLTADLLTASVQERIEELERALQDVQPACQQWQAKTEQINKEILECVGAVAETQSHLEYLEKREVELEGRKAKGQAEIDAIDKVLKELTKKIDRSEKHLAELKQCSFKLSDETSQLKEKLTAKRLDLSRCLDRLENQKADLAAHTSRYHSLQEIQKNKEGFAEGTRQVLQASQNGLQGVLGSVGDMIDTETDFEPAVSAALGEKLQYVVVESHQAGLEAIDYLRGQARGRSTFIPLNVAAAPSVESAAEPGVVGPLLQKVRFRDDYRRIAEYLFGDCLLVEDLHKALDLWQRGPRQKTLVTLQGEVLDAQGLLSGGAGGEKDSMLKVKKRLETLEKEVAAAKVLVAETQTQAWSLKSELEKLESRLESASRDFHGEEIRFVQQEKDHLRLKEEQGRLRQERDRLSLEIARAWEEKKELEAEREKTALALEAKIAQQEALEKALSECQSRLASAAARREELGREAAAAKTKLTQGLEAAARAEKELEKAVQRKLETQETIAKRHEEIHLAREEEGQLQQSLARERRQLEEALQNLERLREQQRGLKEHYDRLAEKIQGREVALRKERQRQEQWVQTLHQTELALAEVKREQQFLFDQMMERYKIDIREQPLPEAADAVDLEAETRGVVELKETLEKLGSVHVEALEEFEDLKRRYDFLSAQETDLEKSIEDLKKAIQKINRVSRERFLTTFEQINQTFQEVFPRLFKGGRAKLILVDEQNLLETGVEIYAQPPGKKLQSISLLSGGEKALTAVALIFSIFLNKPSPFCLLDEVDAPLDDANIDRFNDMIREMTANSQFILITHSKRTMERVDQLYGVTMEEPGISKIVSVRLGAEEPLAKVA